MCGGSSWATLIVCVGSTALQAGRVSFGVWLGYWLRGALKVLAVLLAVYLGRTAGSIVPMEIAKFFHAQWTFLGTANGSPAEFSAMIDHVDACDWRPVIDSVYSLDEISQAHARLDAPDRFGKVAIAIAS